ncbi:MAG TPA: sensor histidine kinase [Devosiaceae bacterium]|jgi:two-component sensor histidine kinase|nr:sensor histidine kinase [Devosiaceae bacterium]
MKFLPSWSLSHRLLVLASVALLPALTILGFNEYVLRQNRQAEINAYALRLGELASLEMQRIVSGAGALMMAVASTPVIQEDDRAGCQSYLRRLEGNLPQLTLISIIDARGAVECTTGNSADEQRIQNDEALRAALAERMFTVGLYTETSEGPALQLGARIAGEDGEATGFVIAALSLSYLGELLRQREFPAGSALTIADREGTILAREPFPEDFVGTRIPDAFMHLVRGVEPDAVPVVSQDGTSRIIGYYPATLPLGLYVSAGVSVEQAMQPIDDATRRGLALTVAGGVIALSLAWLFGRTFISRPVHKLTRAIAAWRSGDRSARTRMPPDASEISAVGAAIDSLLDELEQQQVAREAAERHRDLLNAELEHRVKNLLATVQALASQTFRAGTISEASIQAFTGRLSALGSAHQILTTASWQTASLREVVDAAIELFDGGDTSRFEIVGPRLQLRPPATLGLSLALHELCTNAAKYGALSTAQGTVAIHWQVRDDRFEFSWTEAGGPPVVPPERKGFGSRMIERILASDLEGEAAVDYRHTGVVCVISCPADRALAAEPAAAASAITARSG